MPLNGETISFAGTLGKRVTTKTKTDGDGGRRVNETARIKSEGKENERGFRKTETGKAKGTARRDAT